MCKDVAAKLRCMLTLEEKRLTASYSKIDLVCHLNSTIRYLPTLPFYPSVRILYMPIKTISIHAFYVIDSSVQRVRTLKELVIDMLCHMQCCVSLAHGVWCHEGSPNILVVCCLHLHLPYTTPSALTLLDMSCAFEWSASISQHLGVYSIKPDIGVTSLRLVYGL